MYELETRRIEHADAIIAKLNGCEFQRSDRPWENTGGVLGKDVLAVIPHAVNDAGEINYAVICAVLVEAVKKLQTQVLDLQAQRPVLRVPKAAQTQP